LSALLDVHITNNQGAGLSIAYYDLVDFSVLGGADWNNWGAVTLPVGVCMAGRVDGLEKTFSTTCRFAVTDNDHETPSSHAEECIVSRPQLRIIDGCYTPPPRRPWFRLDESTSSVLTIISIVIALPLFGLYRWYRTRRTRQQVGLEDGQALPLGGLGECTSTGGAGPDVSCVETSRAELPDLVRGTAWCQDTLLTFYLQETRPSAPAM